MPSRVPSLRMLRSFFTDGSLDSLGTSEDARSKRHSTSDLSDVPFSAVRKEGWLHCKQILTKKGKAEDREDMLAWIKVIRENSKAEGEDPGFASQALISKKLNDYRKVSPAGTKPDSSPKGPRGLGIRAEFLKQTGTSAPRSPRQDAAVTKDESSSQKAPWGINIMKKNKKSAPRAFGVRLEDCQPAPDNKNVPLIVEACCKVVEDRGLEYMGIYRVPGNNAVVSSLQEQLNKGATEINLQDEVRAGQVTVPMAVPIPVSMPIMPLECSPGLCHHPSPCYQPCSCHHPCLHHHHPCPHHPCSHQHPCLHQHSCHHHHPFPTIPVPIILSLSLSYPMEPRNLALVFGPTLVRTSEDNMTDMVTHMPDRYKIVETLIQHSDWFFSDKEDKGEKVSPAPSR
ncbi:RHG23 protein, partial [Tichodroma muraria]|nr:RHG23 protein [Tichodroma muraria]